MDQNFPDNIERYSVFWPWYITLITITSVLVSLAHWIFGLKYFELVLKLPLLVNQRQDNLQSKRKRVNLILFAANVYYYVQITVWASFMLVYRRYEDKSKQALVSGFDALNKLLPAILLLCTVLILRCQIYKLQSKAFVAREKLIFIHMSIFLSYIFAYMTFLTLLNLKSEVKTVA